MSFGKLLIKRDSWHARLFQRAYIEDSASWLTLPEKEIMQIYARERAEVPHQCQSSSETARAWRRKQFDTAHAMRAEQLRARFDAGQISLCPYFHMVWWALLWYSILFPLGRYIEHMITVMIPVWIDTILTPIFSAIDFCWKKLASFLDRHSVIENMRIGISFAALLCVGVTAIAVLGYVTFSAPSWYTEWREKSKEFDMREAREEIVRRVRAEQDAIARIKLEQEEADHAAQVAKEYAEYARKMAEYEARQRKMHEEHRQNVDMFARSVFNADERAFLDWNELRGAFIGYQNIDDLRSRAHERLKTNVLMSYFSFTNVELSFVDDRQIWLLIDRPISELEEYHQKIRNLGKKYLAQLSREEQLRRNYELENEQRQRMYRKKEADREHAESVYERKIWGVFLLSIIILGLCIALFTRFGHQVWGYLMYHQFETERGLAQIWFCIQTLEVIATGLARIRDGIVILWHTIVDTATLVAHFLRAAYNGICPYIEFKNGDHTTSSPSS